MRAFYPGKQTLHDLMARPEWGGYKYLAGTSQAREATPATIAGEPVPRERVTVAFPLSAPLLQ